MAVTIERSRFRWPGAVLALLFVLVSASPALGQFLESYKEGLDALEAGDPATAEARFREAIMGRSEETKRLMKGLYLKPYLPYYYLGVALAEQGDCTAALAAWDESEGQGAIAEREEAADLERRRAACLQSLDDRRAAFTVARRALEAASAVAASVDTLARTPELSTRWNDGPDSLAERQQQAVRELARARRELDAAEDAASVQAAGERAEAARKLFMAVRQAATGERAAVQDERRELNEEIDRAVAEARAALERTARLDPAPPEVERLTGRLRNAVGRRGSLSGATSLEDLRAYVEGLRRDTERLGAAVTPPPGELVAAAQAYLEGRPEAVLETLAERRYRSRRTRAHAFLLTAAARFALYERGGSDDAALLEQARADLDAAFEADGDLILSERIFSPRFRALRELEEVEAPPESTDEP